MDFGDRRLRYEIQKIRPSAAKADDGYSVTLQFLCDHADFCPAGCRIYIVEWVIVSIVGLNGSECFGGYSWIDLPGRSRKNPDIGRDLVVVIIVTTFRHRLSGKAVLDVHSRGEQSLATDVSYMVHGGPVCLTRILP